MNLKDSRTKVNLMRAFVGECQAETRYEIGASLAKQQKLDVVEKIFKDIATQELAHANVFYTLLSEFSGEKISVDYAEYPVNVYNSLLDVLNAAKCNEDEEHDVIYKNFSDIAKEEGFEKIAGVFSNIAKIEKVHSERFNKLYTEIKNGTLFRKSEKVNWYCTNCGYICNDNEAPKICPVCQHPQGYCVLYNEWF